MVQLATTCQEDSFFTALGQVKNLLLLTGVYHTLTCAFLLGHICNSQRRNVVQLATTFQEEWYFAAWRPAEISPLAYSRLVTTTVHSFCTCNCSSSEEECGALCTTCQEHWSLHSLGACEKTYFCLQGCLTPLCIPTGDAVCNIPGE